ncbi:hypothetical protein, partial [Rhodosalinus sediminis]|uniref:hypothetical protein n=1 Tax=Rhodosalinus sediminis TaxID=1940533 RepID=UPI0023550D92
RPAEEQRGEKCDDDPHPEQPIAPFPWEVQPAAGPRRRPLSTTGLPIAPADPSHEIVSKRVRLIDEEAPDRIEARRRRQAAARKRRAARVEATGRTAARAAVAARRGSRRACAPALGIARPYARFCKNFTQFWRFRHVRLLE